MANFTINGKKQDLKLTFAGVNELNKKMEGGALEVVAKALQGDGDLLPHVLDAALKHTGENYTEADIMQAIEESFEEERLDLLGIMSLYSEVVSESFFYKAMVTKMLAENPEAKAALDKLLK